MTNAIESLNYSIRKVTKKQAVISDDGYRHETDIHGIAEHLKKRTMLLLDWGGAINQFAIIYGDRVPL